MCNEANFIMLVKGKLERVASFVLNMTTSDETHHANGVLTCDMIISSSDTTGPVIHNNTQHNLDEQVIISNKTLQDIAPQEIMEIISTNLQKEKADTQEPLNKDTQISVLLTGTVAWGLCTLVYPRDNNPFHNDLVHLTEELHITIEAYSGDGQVDDHFIVESGKIMLEEYRAIEEYCEAELLAIYDGNDSEDYCDDLKDRFYKSDLVVEDGWSLGAMGLECSNPDNQSQLEDGYLTVGGYPNTEFSI